MSACFRPFGTIGAGVALALALAAASTSWGRGRPVVSDDTPPGGPQPGAATTPTAVLDEEGRLWVAWVEHGHVRVARSSDRGRSFAPAATANASPEVVDANGESRPSLVIAGHDVFVAWTRKGEQPYTGDIRFAASHDGGQTFSAPITVNDDGRATGHRFQAMARLPDGRLLIAWIDKRDMEAARESGRGYDGAALYAAVSGDAGRSFAPNRKVKDHVCECCRLALTVAPDGTPTVLFRNIFPDSIRDHALVRLTAALEPAAVERVTYDGWQIQACPHHGPALAIVPGGGLHMAWFTGASPRGPGQFYARSDDGGRTFTSPFRLGTEDSLGHPAILVEGRTVTIVWKDRTADGIVTVRLVRSVDGGDTWSPARDVLRGSGSTDHPQLLNDRGEALLAWFTSVEGLRVVPLR